MSEPLNVMERTADRKEPPPPECGEPVRKVEAQFEVPVYLTSEDRRRLHELLSEIVRRDCNQPRRRKHWLAQAGAKPHYSDADRRFLGLSGKDPDGPEGVSEPEFDEEIQFYASSTRLRDEFICPGCYGEIDVDGGCPTPGCDQGEGP